MSSAKEALEDIKGLARVLKLAANQEFYWFAGEEGVPVYEKASDKLKEVLEEYAELQG